MLQSELLYLTKKSDQITVGYKRGQLRTLDLVNEARKPYIPIWKRNASTYKRSVPLCSSPNEPGETSRIGDHPRRLTKEGLYAWWRSVKERTTRQQWEQIADITFHDLRHDFGHRLRASKLL